MRRYAITLRGRPIFEVLEEQPESVQRAVARADVEPNYDNYLDAAHAVVRLQCAKVRYVQLTEGN